MAHSDFTFNGTSLSSLGGVMQRPTIETAERDVKFIELAGKSKDDLIDLGRYKSVTMERNIGFRYNESTHTALAQTTRNWLDGGKGYCVFRDSDHENMFTNAAVINSMMLSNELGRIYKGTVTFKREPFWYSDAGQVAVETEDSGQKPQTVTNPYDYDACPKIVLTLNNSALVDSGALTYSHRVYSEDESTSEYFHLYLTGLQGTVGSYNYVVIDIENGCCIEYTASGTFVQFVVLGSSSSPLNKFVFPANRKTKSYFSGHYSNCAKKSIAPNWRTL